MAYGYGERFDRARHSQGTEVKAITMADGLKIAFDATRPAAGPVDWGDDNSPQTQGSGSG